MKKQIEIDVDGVLANMDGAYAPYVCDIIPDFSEEKYIKEWNMPLVQKEFPEAFQRIKNLWINPNFIANLDRYPKIVEGLQKLSKIIDKNSEIVIHTHILNPGEVYESRENWLEELREDSGVDFDIEISTGKNKNTRKNSYIIIEDNVGNLKKSNAEYKFLVRRGHNKNYTESDLGNCKKSVVCNSFYDCVKKKKKIYRGVTYD